MVTGPPDSPDSPGRERLRQELLSLRELPPAPPILVELGSVLDSEMTSAGTVAEILSRDTALSAKILRLANSAYFGLPKPVADVRAACVVLGFDMIRSLAIGVTALDALGRRVEKILDGEAFWRHSLAVATGARLVATRVGASSPGTAFCAGILHDVGKLVLATIVGSRYASVLRAGELEGGGEALRARELEELGADHATVGAWLGESWHFPPEVLEGVARHHDAGASEPPSRWGAVVHVADRLAASSGLSNIAVASSAVPAATDVPIAPGAAPASAGSPVAPPDPAALAALGIGDDAWNDLLARFPVELESLDALHRDAPQVSR